MQKLRNLAALGIIGILLLISTLPLIFWTKVTRSAHLLYRFSRPFLRFFFFFTGVKLRVEGLEHIPASSPVLVVSNHQSNADGPLITSVYPSPLRVMIKKEARKYPLIGYLFHLAGFVFIDRSDPQQAARALRKAIEQIQFRSHSFLIFPEGTWDKEGKPLPFKKGGFLIAVKTGVPVLPVRISGSFSVLPASSRWFRPGKVQIRFFPPVPLSLVKPLTADTLSDYIESTYYGEYKNGYILANSIA